MKENPSENLVLSNCPCLLPSFSMDNTAAQRFDSTKFSERQPFRNFGAFEPPQQRSGSIAPNFLKETLQKIWCYRAAPVCCHRLQWITQQRSSSIAPTFVKENASEIWCYRTAPLWCHHLPPPASSLPPLSGLEGGRDWAPAKRGWLTGLAWVGLSPSSLSYRPKPSLPSPITPFPFPYLLPQTNLPSSFPKP